MKFTRRRLLLGLGASAAVSGGVLGTGAFTSVEAERTIDVDVAGDNSAFVGLYDTSGGDFVTKNGTAIQIKLDSTGNGGSGVNHGTASTVATTTLDPAFTIVNQGANTMYVQVDHAGTATSGNDVQFVGDDNAGSSQDSTAGDVISTSNNRAFIDRDDGDADLSNDAVTTTVHSGGSTKAIDDAGYITMGTGAAVDVILQVASDGTTTGDVISSATIEAFSDSSASGLLSSDSV